MLAFWGVKTLSTAVANNLPLYGTVALEPPVLLFAAVVTVVAGMLFGGAPAWQFSRAELNDALTLRGEGGGAGGSGIRLGVRSVLVVGQIALCVVLLVSAGLLTRSLLALSRVEPGFDPAHVLTLQFRLPATKYRTEPEIADMFTRALAEIRSVPGVDNAALVRATPLNGNGEETSRSAEARHVAAELERRTTLPVELVDERFTTAAALRAIREMGGSTHGRKGDVDALAATILLQHWLQHAT